MGQKSGLSRTNSVSQSKAVLKVLSMVSLFKDLFLMICLCLGVCTKVQVPWRPEEGIGFSGAGGAGCY